MSMNTDVRLAVLSSCRWDTEGQQQSESIDLHLLLQTEWLQRLHCWHRRKDKRTFPSDAGNSIQIWLAFIKWNYKKVKVEQSGEFNSTVNHDSTAPHMCSHGIITGQICYRIHQWSVEPSNPDPTGMMWSLFILFECPAPKLQLERPGI